MQIKIRTKIRIFTFLAPIFGVVVVDTVLVNSTKSLTLIKDWRLCIADDKE